MNLPLAEHCSKSIANSPRRTKKGIDHDQTLKLRVTSVNPLLECHDNVRRSLMPGIVRFFDDGH